MLFVLGFKRLVSLFLPAFTCIPQIIYQTSVIDQPLEKLEEFYKIKIIRRTWKRAW